MFEKGDIVAYKIRDNKWYKNIFYKIIYINKGDKMIWVAPYFEHNKHFRYYYWKLNPNTLELVKRG